MEVPGAPRTESVVTDKRHENVSVPRVDVSVQWPGNVGAMWVNVGGMSVADCLQFDRTRLRS